MAKLKSRKGKGSYAAYKAENRQEKNQARKRARHAKRHPNDEQSQKMAKAGFKRKAPMAPNNTTPRSPFMDASGKRLEVSERWT